MIFIKRFGSENFYVIRGIIMGIIRGIIMGINRYKQKGMIVERERRDFNRNICRKKYLNEMCVL